MITDSSRDREHKKLYIEIPDTLAYFTGDDDIVQGKTSDMKQQKIEA